MWRGVLAVHIMNYKKELDDKFGPGGQKTERNFYDDLDAVESGVDKNTEITLKREFEAKCPTDGRTDTYTLTVEYRPSDGRVLEIDSFSEWLDELSETQAPQEAWCHFLCHALWAFLHARELRVVVHGEHYGVETTVEKGRVRE